MIKPLDLQNFEIDHLLEAIFIRYGYDFRDYARASLERKILNRVKSSKMASISELTAKILYEPELFTLFLKDMSVTVTEMFRDPYVFKHIKHSIFQHLKTYSRVNIWHVGCATGEEAYSMAVFLKEEGLLKRTRIYATDYNNYSLDIAKKGSYPLSKMAHYGDNYTLAEGKHELSDYYHVNQDIVTFDPSLKEHITFANHNLMKDQVFAQMHLILCRNVMIYFNPTLQNKVLTLLRKSLVHRGFLILGDKESLEFTDERNTFEQFAENEHIYRLIAQL
ncbi:MAG: CheR family methyltransferase [Oleispira sp.]